MMNLFSAIEMGKNSILAQQQVFSIIGHNIANVNTEGYSRQVVDLENVRPSIIGLKYSGRGVDISNIRSIRDQFINNQIVERKWYDGKYNALSGVMASIEALFDEANGLGLSDGLTNFFNAWNDVANNPTDIPTRNQLINTANSFTESMANTYQRLIDEQEVLDGNVAVLVDEINEIINEVALLNEKIAYAEGSQSPTSDLLDQRERRIRELADKVGVNFYYEQSNNSVTIELAGRPLVTYNAVNELSAVRNQYNHNFYDVYIEQYGQPAIDITRDIDLGQLGAMIQARDGRTVAGLGQITNIVAAGGGLDQVDFNQNHGLRVGDLLTVEGQTRSVVEIPDTDTVIVASFNPALTATPANPLGYEQQSGFIPEYLNYLDSLAAGLVRTINDAHQSGYNLNGVNGQNFFDLATGTGAQASITAGSNVVTFSADISGTLNVGDVISINGETRMIANINAAGTTVTVDSQFNNTVANTTWEYTNLETAATLFAIDPALYGNPTLVAASSLPTAEGNNDVALQIARLMDSNSVVDTDVDGLADYGTFHEYLHSLYSEIGNEGNTANYELEANQSMLNYLENRRDSISGVSLDEEAANLMQFEKSYQALAQFMGQVSKLTDILMDIV